jgi:hypothetical protein
MSPPAVLHVLDVVCYITFFTVLVNGLTHAAWLAWMLVGWAIWHRIKLTQGPKPIECAVKNEWLNWFEILKLAGALLALVTVTRYQGEYSTTSHQVTALVLALNIAVAVGSDLQHGQTHFKNAMAGVVLLYFIPYQVDVHMLPQLATIASTRGLFVFPIPMAWAALYTTWNAAFSYGMNFSWSTRVILITPWLIAWNTGVFSVWIGIRALSLCLNMILRATQTTDFYEPGETIITHIHNSFIHHAAVFSAWGLANALFSLVLCVGGL